MRERGDEGVENRPNANPPGISQIFPRAKTIAAGIVLLLAACQSSGGRGAAPSPISRPAEPAASSSPELKKPIEASPASAPSPPPPPGEPPPPPPLPEGRKITFPEVGDAEAFLKTYEKAIKNLSEYYKPLGEFAGKLLSKAQAKELGILKILELLHQMRLTGVFPEDAINNVLIDETGEAVIIETSNGAIRFHLPTALDRARKELDNMQLESKSGQNLLDFLQAHPGQRFSFQDLSASTDILWSTLRRFALDPSEKDMAANRFFRRTLFWDPVTKKVIIFLEGPRGAILLMVSENALRHPLVSLKTSDEPPDERQ